MVAQLTPEETESRLHAGAIETLCRNLRQPREKVASLYQQVLSQVAPRAKVKDYLSIFVSRQVKCVLGAEQRPGAESKACDLTDLLK